MVVNTMVLHCLAFIRGVTCSVVHFVLCCVALRCDVFVYTCYCVILQTCFCMIGGGGETTALTPVPADSSISFSASRRE